MNKNILILCLLILMSASCSKFLDVGTPADTIVSEAVYQSSSSAAGVLTGIYPDLYALMSGRGFFLKCSLMGDDFTLHGQIPGLDVYYNNTYDVNGDFWPRLYGILYRINSAIEGLNASTALPTNIKQQLLGESYFLRAFCYFYLVNLYGGVPLVTKPDYKENVAKGRSSVDDVFEMIVGDLSNAKELLVENYLNADLITVADDRVRPSKNVATALLARVYLHKGDWALAELESSSILEKKSEYDLVSPEVAFIKNNKESIWQLQPSNRVGFNTSDARIFILTNGPDNIHPVSLTASLIESFENGDLRKVNWIGIDTVGSNFYYYPFKYKLYKNDDIDGEYLTMFRLAEQYLIRAEARVQMNNISAALADLNVIRSRAGLDDLGGGEKDSILKSILKERRCEFFSECGHRWFDMKRMGRVNNIMPDACVLKGGQWDSYKQLLPVPVSDIRLNRNITQNPGYSQ